MRIMVTGGAGFLGSHLCRRLVREGHERVVSFDDLSTGNIANTKDLESEKAFAFVKGDIRDQAALEAVMRDEEIDLVYHLAAMVGVKRTIEQPDKVFDVNIDGTLNVLRAARAKDVDKLVHISSSEVYGDPVETPQRETTPKNVSTPYQMSKLVGEGYAEVYHEKYGLKTCSIRPFNVYGPGQEASDYGFVVGIFCARVLAGKPPIVFGDGLQTRDFTYIDDMVEAIAMAGASPKADGQAFNVGAGRPVTILDLAEQVIEMCGAKLEPEFAPLRKHEIRHRFADLSHIRQTLGWRPRVRLEEGLRRTIAQYRARAQHVA